MPTDLPTLSVPAAPVVGLLLRGELERCRESFPLSIFPPSKAPIVHLCYWQLRIHTGLRHPDSEPYEDLLVPAMHIVTQLTYNTGFVSPMTHQATALAMFTLLELTGYEKTKEEAESGLKSLLENRIAPSGWDAAIRDMIVKKRQSGAGAAVATQTAGNTSEQALTASQGLQRLADLATATEEGRADVTTGDSTKENEKIATNATSPFQYFHNLRALVSSGYLNALSSDSVR